MRASRDGIPRLVPRRSCWWRITKPDALRPYPLPKVDDCLLTTIAREPEDEIASVNDEFEINARYHRGLVEWVKYRVFGSSDTDLYDAKKSQDALGAFVG